VRKRLAAVVVAVLAFGCRKPQNVEETLYLAMDNDVLTVDPHQHDDSATRSVLCNVYDPLVRFDRQMRLVPALALSWENPTDLSWRFRLRPGVRFHDGSPLKAADVRYSLERALRSKAAQYLVSISRIEVVDDLTLELHTATPQPVLLNKLTLVDILPSGTPEPLRTAIGTGAYRVADYQKGTALTLEPNDAYWGGRPGIRKAVFKAIPLPAARVEALAKREIHLAREVSAKDRAGGEIPAHVRFLGNAGLVVRYLGVNFQVPGPLLDRNVRRAIFWAIDPREMVRESGVEGVPIDQLVPPSVFGYLARPESGRPRLDLAKNLLREAGFPEGLDATLDMPVGSGLRIAPILTKQLGRAGMRVTVRTMPWPELSARLEKRESPFYSLGWSCYGDASDLLDAMLHTRKGPSYGRSNFGNYSNPALDEAIERAGGILDPTARRTVLQEAMRMTIEDLPLIPLYHRQWTYGVDERLLFDLRQDGQVILSELAWAEGTAARR